MHRPSAAAVRNLVARMHAERAYPHVIGVIRAAVINGQAQPWMYEVLALAMEIEQHPKAEIERVVMAMTDFGGADFGSMLYSAAYLARFDRHAASLRLYRQASRMAIERPEPYILALSHAQKLRSTEDLQWAACGILRYGWTSDAARWQREAEDAALEAIRQLKAAGQTTEAVSFEKDLADARRRDLVVRVTWSGPGDLDLAVEEPLGTVCSFENRDTAGGGIHLHDGYGPNAANCYEEYLCPFGMPGDYRLRIERTSGQIVANRATVEVTRDRGGLDEATLRETVTIGGDGAVLRVALTTGRRTERRDVHTRDLSVPDAATLGRRSATRIARTADEQRVIHAFDDDRRRADALENPAPGAVGVVGYQPVVQVIPEGTALAASAVISADRRYVRIAATPFFSNVTDVFTFSFINGGGAGAANGFGPGR